MAVGRDCRSCGISDQDLRERYVRPLLMRTCLDAVTFHSARASCLAVIPDDRALSDLPADALFLAVNAVKPQCVSRPKIPPTPVPTTPPPTRDFSPSPTVKPTPVPTPARKRYYYCRPLSYSLRNRRRSVRQHNGAASDSVAAGVLVLQLPTLRPRKHHARTWPHGPA